MNYPRLIFHSLKPETTGDLLIFCACFFYGISFPIQKYVMMNELKPITFSALRLFVSALLVVLMRPLLNMSLYDRSSSVARNSGEEHQRFARVEPVSTLPHHYGTVVSSPRFGHSRSRSIDHTFSHIGKTKMRSNSLDENPPSQLQRTTSVQKLENTGYNEADECDQTHVTWELWVMGTLLGVNDGIAAILQQISMVFITGGQSAFITSMYVIAVPIIEWMFPCLHGRMSPLGWIAAIASLFGVFLLSGCGQENCFGSYKGFGFFVAILGMLFWSFSIIIAGKSCPRVNCVDFTCVMFLVSAIFSLLAAFVFEPDQWQYPMESVTNNWIWILATGFTEAFACTLCNIGQKYADDSRAALIMSLESVLAAFACYAFIGEALSPIELLGCAIMLVSTLLTMFAEKEDSEEPTWNEEGIEFGISSAVMKGDGIVPFTMIKKFPTQGQ